LERVCQTNNYRFQWKSQENLPESDYAKNHVQYGFDASEIQRLFPEIVKPDPKLDHLQLNYSELIPVAFKAIQEQQDMIREQHQTISNLESRLQRLEKYLNLN
jgi:hypothetical protein